MDGREPIGPASGQDLVFEGHEALQVGNAPVVAISWGDLYDKIVILELKGERLTAERQLLNVRKELALLQVAARRDPGEDLVDLVSDLREVNAQIWDLDDEIRDMERMKEFDEHFIALARALYQQNDRRAAIKRRINRLLGSDLSEEKSYKAY